MDFHLSSYGKSIQLDNLFDANLNKTLDGEDRGWSVFYGQFRKELKPFPGSGIAPEPAAVAVEKALAEAGATFWARDEIDIRICAIGGRLKTRLAMPANGGKHNLNAKELENWNIHGHYAFLACLGLIMCSQTVRKPTRRDRYEGIHRTFFRCQRE